MYSRGEELDNIFLSAPAALALYLPNHWELVPEFFFPNGFYLKRMKEG